jgi:hypothetical protein
MEYEQFFPTVNFEQQCLPYAYVLTALMAASVIILTCVCDKQEKTKHLQEENKTLKRLISKSIDKMLVKMLKNGNEIVYDDEEQE